MTRFHQPRGVVLSSAPPADPHDVDAEGMRQPDVYVADSANGAVRRIGLPARVMLPLRPLRPVTAAEAARAPATAFGLSEPLAPWRYVGTPLISSSACCLRVAHLCTEQTTNALRMC